MPIIGALDVHRKQITFKWLNTETGETNRGRIVPALRKTVREFFVPFKGLDAHFALEATTGWRFIAEEISRAGLRRILLSRRTPRLFGDRNGEPRRTDVIATIWWTCCSRGDFPNRGFHQSTWWRCARSSGFAKVLSTSVASGSNGFMPNCSIRVCQVFGS